MPLCLMDILNSSKSLFDWQILMVLGLPISCISRRRELTSISIRRATAILMRNISMFSLPWIIPLLSKQSISSAQELLVSYGPQNSQGILAFQCNMSISHLQNLISSSNGPIMSVQRQKYIILLPQNFIIRTNRLEILGS